MENINDNKMEITNQTRNKFGVTGFVISVSGIIVLTFLFGGARFVPGFPFYWWYPFLSLIVIVSGFVFSLVGLIVGINKKLTLWTSVAGLIISIVFLIFIIFIIQYMNNH